MVKLRPLLPKYSKHWQQGPEECFAELRNSTVSVAILPLSEFRTVERKAEPVGGAGFDGSSVHACCEGPNVVSSGAGHCQCTDNLSGSGPASF